MALSSICPYSLNYTGDCNFFDIDRHIVNFGLLRWKRFQRFGISGLEFGWVPLVGFGSEIQTLFSIFDNKVCRNESIVAFDAMSPPISLILYLNDNLSAKNIF